MRVQRKQNVMIGMIVLVLLILIWQVSQLVKSESGESSSAATLSDSDKNANLAANNNSPATVTATPAITTDVNATNDPAFNDGLNNADSSNTNNNASVDSANNSPKSQRTVLGSIVHTDGDAVVVTDDPKVTVNQQKYLQLVAQYQIAQLQRMIAEDEEAIAVARNHAAKAIAETAHINNAQFFSAISSVMPQTINHDYELIFTGQQGNLFAATLQKDGHFYDVRIGTRLPDDTQVVSINQDSVLLKKNNEQKLVTFSGVSNLATANAGQDQTLTQNNTSANADVIAVNVSSNSTQQQPKNIGNVNSNFNPAIPVPAAVKKTISVAKAISNNDANDAAVAVAARNDSQVKQLNAGINNHQQIKPKSNVVADATDRSSTGSNTSPSGALGNQTQGINELIINANPNSYTIQLIADNEISAIHEYMQSNKLENQAIPLTTRIHGKNLYILVYGQYQTNDQAAAAIRHLPKSALLWHPFVRKIGDVQRGMLRKEDHV